MLYSDISCIFAFHLQSHIMKLDTHKTDMVFRIDKSGVFALFPHEVCDNKGHVTTYQHVGQHSGANYTYCIQQSKKATPEQYKALFDELTSIGYNINIVHRQNYKLYLKDYYRNVS